MIDETCTSTTQTYNKLCEYRYKRRRTVDVSVRRSRKRMTFCEKISRKRSRSLPGRMSNSRESVSVLASVNTIGERIPPMAVVKGKTRRSLDSWAS